MTDVLDAHILMEVDGLLKAFKAGDSEAVIREVATGKYLLKDLGETYRAFVDQAPKDEK